MSISSSEARLLICANVLTELNNLLSTAVPNLDKILFYGSSGEHHSLDAAAISHYHCTNCLTATVHIIATVLSSHDRLGFVGRVDFEHLLSLLLLFLPSSHAAASPLVLSYCWFGFGHLPFNLTLTHSLSLVLVMM